MKKISLMDQANINRFGPTQVLDWLYLGGEEDVDEVLYGKLLTEEDIQRNAFPLGAKVDIWIDFRDTTKHDRKIICPSRVTYVRIPFQDGDVNKARRSFEIARLILDHARRKEQKILVTCHAGVSRSALFVLSILVEHFICFRDAYAYLISRRSHVAIHPNFDPIIEELKNVV